MTHPVFSFETTHMALWAEEVARDRRIPAEVIPAPAGAQGKCNLALETLERCREDLSRALEAEGVEFYPPA